MAGWTLFFVLLLPPTLSSDSEVTLEKTIRSKPDVTPICSNDTMSIVTLVVCKISTKRSRGEECRLLYQLGQNFESECGSRFTLMKDNQTVFLHLTSLTPEDSGNYTCECSYPDGTNILHLNITVEEDEEPSSSTEILIPGALAGVTIVVSTTGVIVGFILKSNCCRGCSRSATSGLTVYETPGSVDQGDPDDPYTNLQSPASDLYQTISSVHHQHDTRTNSANNTATVHLDNQEVDGREICSSSEAYENV